MIKKFQISREGGGNESELSKEALSSTHLSSPNEFRGFKTSSDDNENDILKIDIPAISLDKDEHNKLHHK